MNLSTLRRRFVRHFTTEPKHHLTTHPWRKIDKVPQQPYEPKWYFEHTAKYKTRRDTRLLFYWGWLTVVSASLCATINVAERTYSDQTALPNEPRDSTPMFHTMVRGAKFGALGAILLPVWVPTMLIGVPCGYVYARFNPRKQSA